MLGQAPFMPLQPQYQQIQHQPLLMGQPNMQPVQPQMMFGGLIDTKFAKFVELEQEKATNPNRGIRLVNLAAASFFFYFSFYDLLSTIGNGSVSGFTIPGDIIAMGYGCLNLVYHYKAQPIGIHLILLYVVSILFYTAYLNMFIFQLLIFDMDPYHN